MIIMYVICGILIVIAIVITPFSIKARRKTLKEIDALRSAFKEDVKELTDKIECRIVKSIDKQQDSLQFGYQPENLRQLHYDLKFAHGTSKILPARESELCYAVLKKIIEDSYNVFQFSNIISPQHVWREETQEDVWDAAKLSTKAHLVNAIQYKIPASV